MKWTISIILVVLAAVTVLPVVAQDQPAKAPEAAGTQGLSAEERQKQADRLASLKQLQSELDALKAEQKKQIGQLQAVRALAQKEKAAETVKLLDKVIRERTEAFAAQQRPLEKKLTELRQIDRQLQPRPDRPARTARQAPPFTLQSFDGKKVSLADFKGKIVVLEWFNLECPFCMYNYEKAKTMIPLAKKYADKNVVWLAINSTSHTTPQANKEFIAKYKLPYPILDDRTGTVGHAYGATNTPQMFVINTSGVIVYDGEIDNAPLGEKKGEYVNYVDKALAELIAGKGVSTGKTTPYGCTVKYAQK